MFDIDINFMRVVVTLLSFASFIAIVVWALSRRNQPAFDEAARLPFDGDVSPANARSATSPSEARDE